MLGELLLRFALGGGIVSAFALVGEVFEPKTFSGIFGAAPSLALATVTLSFADRGGEYVAKEGLPMAAGAVALTLYAAACVATTKRYAVPVWLVAGASWLVWLGVALALWKAGVAVGLWP